MSMNLPSWARELRKPARIKAIYGGRGGGKSQTAARIMLAYGLERGIRVLCCREIQRSISDSIKKNLEDLIFLYKLPYQILRDRIYYAPTGTEFIFAGLQDAQKIKSYEGIDYVIVEEAQCVSKKSIEILEPTIRKKGSEIWYIFNPFQVTDPVYQEHVLNRREGNLAIKVNYWDNPWFNETALVKEMEWCRENRPDDYKHIWCGEPIVNTDRQIFKGCWRIGECPEPPVDVILRYGADWGFSTDPSTLVRCWIRDRTLYIDREVRAVKLPLKEHAALFDKVEGSRNNRIIADSARPETIDLLRGEGFDIIGAKKGKGSVEDGITFLRNFDIVVSPDLTDVIQEFSLYSYKVDKKTDEIYRTIEDSWNHSIDAIRYALEPVMRGNRNTVGKIEMKGFNC